ncbi:MAG TPA: hypothetical protein VHA13_04885 [Gammaproteobacteria bacterium]|nr:hypothetical protein [Gammaproteobacteria bacterium]
MKRSILALMLMLSTPVFAASLVSLTKSEINAILQEKTVTTIPVVKWYENLVIHNPASIYFAKDGALSGRFTSQPDNGPQTDTGRWKIESNGQLCLHWKVWANAKPSCAYAYKLANALIFVNTDKKFETLIPLNNIEIGNQVN